VLAPEGRDTTHYYPAPDNQAPGWDNWYRQLNPAGDVTIGKQTWRENVDAATIDHFADEVTRSGIVKTDQVYVSGWSNGAAMGYLYGLSRPSVAAIGVYSAPDPFRAFNDPCPQNPVLQRPASIGEVRVYNPRVPTLHIHNDCDIAGICPNGEYLKGQLEGIGISTDDTIINALTLQVPTCLAACGTNPDGDPNNPLAVSEGTANHVRWPSDWLPTMLAFFHAHPKNLQTRIR
jgi:poly(3-hydroxybutyrate) depolymerase